ncbi:hypothetical protein WJX73_002272 [Symbiochloris irregularis]|uniref:Uncharacterized protein n=1 Tax=Symbiochloris irregularis TaxID=706552 RepID=A0AAW1NVR7_9CHLO
MLASERWRALCLSLFLLVAHTAAQAPPEHNSTCPNHPADRFTYGRVRLPSLKVEATFQSQRPRSPSDITIVTQCSVDRLPMLREQCKSWLGITSVAVYWPLMFFQANNTDSIKAAVDTVQQFHTALEAEGWCRMDMALVSEVVKTHDLWAYPYNALRNQALARAATEVVLLLDADFVVSAGLHERLSASTQFAALTEDTAAQRNAIVLPAFETEASLGIEAGGQIATDAQKSNKEQLKELFDSRKIIQFAEFYPVGHRSTNYKKWFTTSIPYSIKFKSGYEPYVLVSRRHMPWYDERFRGYGWDKVMQIYQLDALDFRFLAHPSAFVMHRPHPPSSGYNHTFTGEAYTQKHKPTDHLWKMERIAKDMMAELRVGTYPDRGVTALHECRMASRAEPVTVREHNWW